MVRTDSTAHWPEILPEGNAVLFTATGPQIWMHSLKTGQRRLLVERGSHARYVSSGHLIYASDGLLMAAPFDAQRVELIGPAIPVIEGVMMTRPGAPALGHFAVSTSGSLAYLAGPARSESPASSSLGSYVRANRNFDISPDGRRFLMIKEATPILEPSARDEITVVLNWTRRAEAPRPDAVIDDGRLRDQQTAIRGQAARENS